MSTLYDTHRWRELRSRYLGPDAECVLSGLAGECRGLLHVHHVKPVSEGGPDLPHEDGLAVLCARHHRLVHAWIKAQDKHAWKTCPHQHRTRESREQCERRLNAA